MPLLGNLIPILISDLPEFEAKEKRYGLIKQKEIVRFSILFFLNLIQANGNQNLNLKNVIWGGKMIAHKRVN